MASETVNLGFEQAMDRLASSARQMIFLGVGLSTAKNLLGKAAEKFIEGESLPVKINYIDWWPKTCQKVKEFVSTLWTRRVEGATTTALAGGALSTAYIFNDTHSAATATWDLAVKVNEFFLNSMGLGKLLAAGKDIPTLMVLPTLLGAAATLSLGAHDLYSKYFDRDRVLETKPIFNAKLQAELDEILATTCFNKEEKGVLQNILLYGPPGTGKTMISKWIAKNSHMNYILLSGGDLLKTLDSKPGQGAQTGAGGSVALLQKLIEIAKNCSSPTLIFIDEAEACLGKRDLAKSQELISLLNAFLELTGQPSSKMMLVLATNRPETIDAAVLSRMDYKIYVGAPETAERKMIIERTVQILLQAPQEKAIFSPYIIDHIAKQTSGFSGRDLFKLINRLKVEARRQGTLTTEGIDKVLARFAQQEKQIQVHNSSENPLAKNPFYKAAAAG